VRLFDFYGAGRIEVNAHDFNKIVTLFSLEKISPPEASD
jgi:hypothetical protein